MSIILDPGRVLLSSDWSPRLALSAGGAGWKQQQHWTRRSGVVCVVDSSGSGSGGGRELIISAVGTRATTSGAARERRLQKAAEEKRLRAELARPKYPEWASILKDACKDDVELREIIGDSFGNPEEMCRRVEERARRKGPDVLSPKTGSAVPMTVTFKSEYSHMVRAIWRAF